VLAGLVLYQPPGEPVKFPDGKRFALTIVDDTDLTTLERVRPLYRVLEENGLRTTKTVWMFPSNRPEHAANRGVSLEDSAYREFITELHDKGFEIALHGVRGGTSSRPDIIAGLENFRTQFGQYPRMQVNHSMNGDNLYWGAHRWSFPLYQWLYGIAVSRNFSGHDENSPNFWGDIAQTRVDYVRSFTYREINLLNEVPSIPYRIDDMPYVNLWYPGSDGGSIEMFYELLKPENLVRLEQQGGVCIIYAHMGAGSFNTPDGEADPRFVERVEDIARRNGWYVPASELLDHLSSQPGWDGELSLLERVRLETSFLLGRLMFALET
jgi:hypothetical protein